MGAPTATATRRWTYDEYARLDDGKRSEVVAGKLVPAPGAGSDHQGISRDIEFALLRFVQEKGVGVVFDAPLDVVLDELNVLQPDVLFVSRPKLSIVRKAGVFGAPDLVIEILSPSTAENDRYHKRDAYERFGVKEYWIVDPENRTIEVLANGPKGFELHSFATPDGKATSKLLPGFEVLTKDIIPERSAEGGT